MKFPDSCRLAPYDHQFAGTAALLNKSAFALFDEMGVGKSKQVVDAVCHAYVKGVIDTLLVVAPAPARSVWASPNPLLGEVAKHVWEAMPHTLMEFSSDAPFRPRDLHGLAVVATNYELVRRPERLATLIAFAEARKTWLVLDESWAVQNHSAAQTKAIKKLRKVCKRVTLLNGTPGKPEQLYAQFDIMDPAILGQRNFFTFRARYCLMGGWQNKKVTGYQRMDEFRAKTAPYALRRLAKDCLDLPEVLEPITIEARLTPQTWLAYKQMRDELVLWLSSHEASVASHAGTRTVRLAQILAGFVGGVQPMEADDLFDGPPDAGIRQVGTEKRDALLSFLDGVDPDLKVIVWGRFRPEMEGYRDALLNQGTHAVHMLWGQQPEAEREATKLAFAPGTTVGRARMVGHPAAGGAGLNFAAASLNIYATNPWGLKNRQQSEKRIDRPGQTRRPQHVDIVAVGPQGQKTLDHAVLATLRANGDIAAWTAETWRQVLSEE